MVVVFLMTACNSDVNMKKEEITHEEIINTSESSNYDKEKEKVNMDEWNVDENTIIWAFFDDIAFLGNVEERVNARLDADGFPFRIKCINMGIKEYTQRVKESKADIVFDGISFQDSECRFSVMHDAILEEKFLKLDEYLDGSLLYDFFPESIWNSIKVNESIYCIPNTNFGDFGLSVAFKRNDYTEEELKSFNGTLESLLKMVDQNRKLYYWDRDGWTGYLDMYDIQNYEEYGIYYEDGEIKNLMDLDINIRWIKELHNLAEQGMLINGKNIIYQDCKDDWSVALLDSGRKLDLNEDDYYIIRYIGDMYPHYGGAIAIRENSHNPQYAFKMIELFLTNPEYGNLIIYGENVTEKDGYAVDSNSGNAFYSWNKRIQWGINDGVLRGIGDENCTFSSPEERKEFYSKYYREAETSVFDYYELCNGLSNLIQKHKNIIFKKGDIDEELNEWIKESDEIFEKYGP